jgi:hypothetical protein
MEEASHARRQKFETKTCISFRGWRICAIFVSNVGSLYS